MIHPIYPSIQKDLLSIASKERSLSMQNFFKNEIHCHGISNPDVQQIGKKYIAILKKDKFEAVLPLIEQLFQSTYHEEALLACQLVYAFKKQYTIKHFELFESWIKNYVTNWAICDTFCNKVMGEMIFQFPSCTSKIKTWCLSEQLYVRRASAVSFIYPAKKKQFINDQFEIALLLLEDQEDLVQKGYGWMLKVLSGVCEQEVFDFVQMYKSRMPRTALRYAIEKMDNSKKQLAMQKD